MQKLRHRQRGRSFAGAADGEIAQANNWQAGLPPRRPHPQPRHSAIKRGQRG
jgi:hypothetical protein